MSTAAPQGVICGRFMDKYSLTEIAKIPVMIEDAQHGRACSVVSEPVIKTFNRRAYRFCVVRDKHDTSQEWSNVEQFEQGRWRPLKNDEIDRSVFLYQSSAQVYAAFQAQKMQAEFSFDPEDTGMEM